ncbi:MAG: thioredoxin family protein [Mogibacterium sp.]|nr:thioredoxin family protein [Mogibacterium sp.]MBQ6500091.1 thioredoxin family protein [Mogibacterium sp.]
MKKITMFHINECKYCDMARQAIEELREEDPEYNNIEIEMINEDEHPEIIENYDYWSVPSLFIDHNKIFEAALFMPYETIKEGVKLAFDKALEEPEPEYEDFGEDIHDPCLRFQK